MAPPPVVALSSNDGLYPKVALPCQHSGTYLNGGAPNV